MGDNITYTEYINIKRHDKMKGEKDGNKNIYNGGDGVLLQSVRIHLSGKRNLWGIGKHMGLRSAGNAAEKPDQGRVAVFLYTAAGKQL